jgi:chaperonin GroES
MLKPLHKQVILVKEANENVTPSGIVLTSGKEQSKFARVVSAGPDVENPGYVTGDKVLYKEYAGTVVILDKKEYVVIEDDDILAVLEG